MDLILHHFDISPFAEKIRLALGLKQLAWQSVQIPMVMPKPDLTELTGGYRKTPVLQVGADIYCDTQRIALELERRFPQPSLFPGQSRGLCLALAHWSDVAFFRPGAALSLGTNDALPEDILRDRRAFFSFIDFQSLPQSLPHYLAEFRSQLALLDDMLADGRAFLLGGQPGWADILGVFPVWMCRGNIRDGDALLAEFAGLAAWEKRVNALGHGSRQELSAEEALAIARSTVPATGGEIDEHDPLGLRRGDPVRVTSQDYGAVPVEGVLESLTVSEVALRRHGERVGEVVVHFPRAGYHVEKT
ncbi:MAG: glutathione S-transferase [Haliea sp.]|nr:glutathione S-transferase [Haliea sp.]|tara:strand:- start:2851 stop:3762 length:912 start_codon:yes stop_codon:yes gene_type:complete